MRFPPILAALILLAAASGARAQQQEQKLIDRIMKPNMGMTYDLRKSSFGTSGSVSTKSANVKAFAFDQKFSPKSFDTKEFSGAKTSWLGNFKFATKAASTKTFATKEAPTKTMPVKDAREADKTMATQTYADQKTYSRRGASQDRFDKNGAAQQAGDVGWTGDMKAMTIDDVRTLLNKNK